MGSITHAIVVLPAYNEAPALGLLLDRLTAVMQSLGPHVRSSILVVDDGSHDQTATVAAGRQAVHVIRHTENRGLAAALHTGISVALRSLPPDGAVIVMDADDTHDPAAIPAMLARLNTESDVVIGSRFAAGGGESGVPWYRRILSRGAALLMKGLCPVNGVLDYTSGYRAYRKGALEYVLAACPEVFSTSGFSVTLALLLALRGRALVSEVPVTVHYERKQGLSKMPILRTALGAVAVARHLRRAS